VANTQSKEVNLTKRVQTPRACVITPWLCLLMDESSLTSSS
jgi:hypothetical protein